MTNQQEINDRNINQVINTLEHIANNTRANATLSWEQALWKLDLINRLAEGCIAYIKESENQDPDQS